MNKEDEAISARFEAILDEEERRDSLPFNGVMGAMPEWVPEPSKDEFRRTRNSLLNNYSENQIIKWINEYKMMVEATDEIFTPKITYEHSLQPQIERLFILSYAVELGEIEGLRYLAGDVAVMGKRKSISTHKNASKLRPKKNDYGESLNEVIAKLKRYYPHLRPHELWVHLKTEIELWSEADCKEYGEKDSRSYHFEIGEKRGSIAYGTFRKKLNK